MEQVAEGKWSHLDVAESESVYAVTAFFDGRNDVCIAKNTIDI